jgi:uncharacterized cupin superfamily protein
MDTKIGLLSETPATSGTNGTIKAELFANRREAQLGKAVGLRQFGINHVTLDPGAYSSLRHWHEGEDEFVYVLSGEVTLIDENGAHVLREGAYVGFPAGAANAHHLTNRSSAPACLLVVGTRRQGRETIHYPDDGIGPFTVERDVAGNRIR